MYKVHYKESKLLLRTSHKKQLGVTLLELLITVAIIGILASIAYPSYTDFVMRSNRSEAQRELLRYANLQEQFYVDTRAYADDMTGLGGGSANIKTESKNYEISVEAQTATTFTLNAEAKLMQIKDTGCEDIKINELGVKTPTICWE